MPGVAPKMLGVVPTLGLAMPGLEMLGLEMLGLETLGLARLGLEMLGLVMPGVVPTMLGVVPTLGLANPGGVVTVPTGGGAPKPGWLAPKPGWLVPMPGWVVPIPGCVPTVCAKAGPENAALAMPASRRSRYFISHSSSRRYAVRRKRHADGLSLKA